MDQITMASAFNEWMRRFTEEPERYEHEFQTVQTFLSDQAAGREPNYGEICTRYMHEITKERLSAKT